MQHYASYVADEFAEAAQADANHVGVGFVADAEEELEDEGKAEGCGEEGVPGEGRVVAVYCGIDGTLGGDGGAPFGGLGAVGHLEGVCG